MENHIIKLHRGATAVSIRQYFEGILYLQSKNDTPFPIDLDTVWQLAYERKDHAVRILKDTFIEGTDFQTIPQKWEAGKHNKTVINKYYLTVPAMEWFVARRVPQVFEVYRSVFHASAKKALPSADSQYLNGLIGSPLVVNNTNYWPYNLVMVSAGYKRCPHRLYQFANRNITGMKLFSDETPMFIREYGRVWARAEVFTYLAKRRDAWVALNDANKEFIKMLG